MKNILIPCDFSLPAVNAFRFALDVAQRSNGTVHLLHVIEPTAVAICGAVPVLNIERRLEEADQHTKERFHLLITKYPVTDVKTFTSVEVGRVHEAVNKYVSEHAIDIVIMGSHGASGFREMLVGSNAQRVVRHCPVPVLIIKDYFWGPVTNIVFPNSLEDIYQGELVAQVKMLQEFFKARLHLVFINTPMNFVSDELTQERLSAFAKKYELQNCTLNVFNHPNQEEGMLAFAHQVDADIIAIGTHNREGVVRLIHGSLGEDIANHSEKLVWSFQYKSEFAEQRD